MTGNPLNVAVLTQNLEAAASGTINADISQLRGFSRQQLQAIAQQAAYVAGGIADGSIGDTTRDFFLNSLEEMARSFANTLAGLMAVVVEQVWNALVKTLWSAINDATGLALKIP